MIPLKKSDFSENRFEKKRLSNAKMAKNRIFQQNHCIVNVFLWVCVDSRGSP